MIFVEIIGIIIVGIAVFINIIKKAKGKNKIYGIYMCLCVVVATISYFFNMGWIRMVIAPLPAILLIILYWKINSDSIELIDKTNKLNIFIILNGITLLLSNFLLSDYGDTNGYVFFGQVKDRNIISICDLIFPVMLILHITVLLLQLIYTKKLKKNA